MSTESPATATKASVKKASNSSASKILILLVVIFAGATVYFYLQTVSVKQDPASVAKKEATELVLRVGQLIVLPEDEVPTVATVSDPEKLKDQPFFVGAKTGDKVLIYTKAKKAVLYDPVANKIIQVAPINIGAASSTKTSVKPTPAPVTEAPTSGTSTTVTP